MLKRLLAFAFPASSATAAAPAAEKPLPPARRPVAPGVPVYPPIDQGVIRVEPQAVIDSQTDLLRRIRLLAGTDDADFERRYFSVIRRLANHIQLLPASETDTHPGPGGLFRLALELAFFSAQAAESVVFAGRATAEDRRREEPRWRYATFLAGMCCELHRCVTAMQVVDVTGRVWPAFNLPISEWLAQSDSDRYFVRWSTGSTGSMATAGLLVEKIAGGGNLQYLQDGSLRIVPSMMDAIAGVRSHEKSALADVIDRIRDKVIHRDKSIQPAQYGKLSVGSHLEPHLLDAMRQLMTSGKWVVNEKKSRLWYSKAGLFLVWRTAAKEMLEVLARNSVQGVPQDAQTLLDILLAANVFAIDNDGSPYWMIIPPGGQSELPAVKFANPMTLFGTLLDEVTPVEGLDGVTASPKAPIVTEAAEPPAEPLAAATTSQPEEAAQPAAPAPSAAAAPSFAAGAAIPEVEDGDNPQAAKIPTAVAATLRPATREVMNAILNEHLTKSNRDKMGKMEHGFAISIEHLASYGVELEELLKQLYEAGWLYSPPEKPAKKVHQYVLNNRKLDVVIIRNIQAKDAGLIQ